MGQQWKDALRRADEVRVWRAEQRRRIKAGDVEHGYEVLLSFDRRIDTMEIIEYLVWFPGIGHTVAKQMIQRAFVYPTIQTPHRQIGKIDMETVLRLVAELRGRTERIEKRRERLAA